MEELLLEIAGLEDNETMSHEHGDPFGDCDTSARLDVLPETCSVELMQSRHGCSFQLPLTHVLGTRDLFLQIAVGTCPASLMPFLSIRMGGVGANNLLAPCGSDDDCSAGHTCFDLAKVVTRMPDDVAPWDEFAQTFLDLAACEYRDQHAPRVPCRLCFPRAFHLTPRPPGDRPC